MRKLINGLLQLGLTAGVVVLLFVVYQTYVTDYFSDRQQAQVAEDLRDDWDQPSVPGREQPDFGEGFAFLHIPEFGAGWSRAVVEGAKLAELEAAPGHYAGTAMPGDIGNFAVAGHRNGNGSPFNRLDELEPGDSVIVETVDTWFTYTVTESRIIEPSDTGVLHPDPGGAIDDAPVDAYLTLTTCHPEFSVKERLIVHALLSATVLKAEAPNGPDAMLSTASASGAAERNGAASPDRVLASPS